jgi:hypothetical protein
MMETGCGTESIGSRSTPDVRQGVKSNDAPATLPPMILWREEIGRNGTVENPSGYTFVVGAAQ